MGRGEALGDGAGILVVASTSTGCHLGAAQPLTKGKSLAQTATEAVQALLKDLELRACVDEYLQDQLIIYMALAQGESRVRAGPEVTLHTQTAIEICKQLTGAEFKVEKQADGAHLITCKGAAVTRA